MKTNKTIIETVEETAAATKAKVESALSAKLKRWFGNAFRMLVFKKTKQATVVEVGLDSIFAKIEADKRKIGVKIEAQKKLIEERNKAAKKASKSKDESIKKLEKRIADLKKKRDDEDADNKTENEKIIAEQVRGQRVIDNMNKFYGLDV